MIQLELTDDEAIVLFEFLFRFTHRDNLSIAHKGERTALWNLHCGLEKELRAPFLPEYPQLLVAARERLAPPVG